MSDAVRAAIAKRREILATAHEGHWAAEDRLVLAYPAAPHGKEQPVPPLLTCFPPGPGSPGSVTPFNAATMLHYLGVGAASNAVEATRAILGSHVTLAVLEAARIIRDAGDTGLDYVDDPEFATTFALPGVLRADIQPPYQPEEHGAWKVLPGWGATLLDVGGVLRDYLDQDVKDDLARLLGPELWKGPNWGWVANPEDSRNLYRGKPFVRDHERHERDADDCSCRICVARMAADEFGFVDVDGDGEMDLEEAIGQGMTRAMFLMVDADGSGTITQEEYDSFKKEHASAFDDSSTKPSKKGKRRKAVSGAPGPHVVYPPCSTHTELRVETDCLYGDHAHLKDQKTDVIAIYFSAHPDECPKSLDLTAKLMTLYETMRGLGKAFEVVYCSLDVDRGKFDEVFAEMPWYAIPYHGKESYRGGKIARDLAERFKIDLDSEKVRSAGALVLIELDELGRVKHDVAPRDAKLGTDPGDSCTAARSVALTGPSVWRRYDLDTGVIFREDTVAIVNAKALHDEEDAKTEEQVDDEIFWPAVRYGGMQHPTIALKYYCQAMILKEDLAAGKGSRDDVLENLRTALAILRNFLGLDEPHRKFKDFRIVIKERSRRIIKAVQTAQNDLDRARKAELAAAAALAAEAGEDVDEETAAASMAIGMEHREEAEALETASLSIKPSTLVELSENDSSEVAKRLKRIAVEKSALGEDDYADLDCDHEALARLFQKKNDFKEALIKCEEAEDIMDRAASNEEPDSNGTLVVDKLGLQLLRGQIWLSVGTVYDKFFIAVAGEPQPQQRKPIFALLKARKLIGDAVKAMNAHLDEHAGDDPDGELTRMHASANDVVVAIEKTEKVKEQAIVQKAAKVNFAAEPVFCDKESVLVAVGMTYADIGDLYVMHGQDASAESIDRDLGRAVIAYQRALQIMEAWPVKVQGAILSWISSCRDRKAAAEAKRECAIKAAEEERKKVIADVPQDALAEALIALTEHEKEHGKRKPKIWSSHFTIAQIYSDRANYRKAIEHGLIAKDLLIAFKSKDNKSNAKPMYLLGMAFERRADRNRFAEDAGEDYIKAKAEYVAAVNVLEAFHNDKPDAMAGVLQGSTSILIDKCTLRKRIYSLQCRQQERELFHRKVPEQLLRQCGNLRPSALVIPFEIRQEGSRLDVDIRLKLADLAEANRDHGDGSPRSHEYHVRLGGLYEEQFDFGEAFSHFSKALCCLPMRADTGGSQVEQVLLNIRPSVEDAAEDPTTIQKERERRAEEWAKFEAIQTAKPGDKTDHRVNQLNATHLQLPLKVGATWGQLGSLWETLGTKCNETATVFECSLSVGDDPTKHQPIVAFAQAFVANTIGRDIVEKWFDKGGEEVDGHFNEASTVRDTLRKATDRSRRQLERELAVYASQLQPPTGLDFKPLPGLTFAGDDTVLHRYGRTKKGACTFKITKDTIHDPSSKRVGVNLHSHLLDLNQGWGEAKTKWQLIKERKALMVQKSQQATMTPLHYTYALGVATCAAFHACMSDLFGNEAQLTPMKPWVQARESVLASSSSAHPQRHWAYGWAGLTDIVRVTVASSSIESLLKNVELLKEEFPTTTIRKQRFKEGSVHDMAATVEFKVEPMRGFARCRPEVVDEMAILCVFCEVTFCLQQIDALNALARLPSSIERCPGSSLEELRRQRILEYPADAWQRGHYAMVVCDLSLEGLPPTVWEPYVRGLRKVTPRGGEHVPLEGGTYIVLRGVATARHLKYGAPPIVLAYPPTAAAEDYQHGPCTECIEGGDAKSCVHRTRTDHPDAPVVVPVRGDKRGKRADVRAAVGEVNAAVALCRLSRVYAASPPENKTKLALGHSFSEFKGAFPGRITLAEFTAVVARPQDLTALLTALELPALGLTEMIFSAAALEYVTSLTVVGSSHPKKLQLLSCAEIFTKVNAVKEAKLEMMWQYFKSDEWRQQYKGTPVIVRPTKERLELLRAQLAIPDGQPAFRALPLDLVFDRANALDQERKRKSANRQTKAAEEDAAAKIAAKKAMADKAIVEEAQKAEAEAAAELAAHVKAERATDEKERLAQCLVDWERALSDWARNREKENEATERHRAEAKAKRAAVAAQAAVDKANALGAAVGGSIALETAAASAPASETPIGEWLAKLKIKTDLTALLDDIGVELAEDLLDLTEEDGGGLSRLRAEMKEVERNKFSKALVAFREAVAINDALHARVAKQEAAAAEDADAIAQADVDLDAQIEAEITAVEAGQNLGQGAHNFPLPKDWEMLWSQETDRHFWVDLGDGREHHTLPDGYDYKAVDLPVLFEFHIDEGTGDKFFLDLETNVSFAVLPSMADVADARGHAPTAVAPANHRLIDDLPTANLEVTPSKITPDEFIALATNQIPSSDQKEEQKGFNRYFDILPNPHSHVQLTSEVGMPDDLNDKGAFPYINANYIRGWDGAEKQYIAVQGPMAPGIAQFWRMIWQDNCRAVVMVTRKTEQGKSKCDSYWEEEEGGSVDHAGFTVKTVSVKRSSSNYSLTTLELSAAGETRQVYHFWYDGWPDLGVPSTNAKDIIDLAKMVNRCCAAAASPMVVHCSAGIGRTGVFIGLDQAIHQLHADYRCDLVETIGRLREDRGGMVQTTVQAEFLLNLVTNYANGSLGNARAMGQVDRDIAALFAEEVATLETGSGADTNAALHARVAKQQAEAAKNAGAIAKADEDLDAHIEAQIAAQDAGNVADGGGSDAAVGDTDANAALHARVAKQQAEAAKNAGTIAQADANLDAQIEAQIAAQDAGNVADGGGSDSVVGDTDANAALHARVAKQQAEAAKNAGTIAQADANLDAQIEAQIAAQMAAMDAEEDDVAAADAAVGDADTNAALHARVAKQEAAATENAGAIAQADVDLDAQIEAQIAAQMAAMDAEEYDVAAADATVGDADTNAALHARVAKQEAAATENAGAIAQADVDLDAQIEAAIAAQDAEE